VRPDAVQHRFGARHDACLPSLDCWITCAPAPCDRRSRSPWWDATPTTTMGTPSPAGSRPVGDPAVRLRPTCRARRRPPTHLLARPRWAAPCAMEVASAPRFMPEHGAASVAGVMPMGAHSHRWTLGFQQSRLGHIARVVQRTALDASGRPLFSWPALVPSRFRVQVSQLTQERPSQCLPTALGIQRSASRRTPGVPLSPHTATAYQDLYPRFLSVSNQDSLVYRGVGVR
jgi:hypothetical protein